MVPQPPRVEHAIRAATDAEIQSLAKVIEERIKVVITDQENASPGMVRIMLANMSLDLQTHRRLSRSLGAENNRCRRFRRIAVDFVPHRVIGALNAVFLEHRVGLRILLGKRVALNAMVLEETLNIHVVPDAQERKIEPSATSGRSSRRQRAEDRAVGNERQINPSAASGRRSPPRIPTLMSLRSLTHKSLSAPESRGLPRSDSRSHRPVIQWSAAAAKGQTPPPVINS